MLSVTFSQPIHIDAANLHSLLSLANVPAVVEPYAEHAVEVAPAAKRTRKAAASTDAAPKKRIRRTKAQIEADNLAAAGGAPAADPAPEPEAPKPTAAPEAAASDTTTSTAAAPDKAPAKKRDRRSAAKKAADAAAEAAAKAPAKAAPKAKAEPKAKKETSSPAGGGAASADAPTAEAMLARFAVLIDTDFDAAKKLLDEFGVKRFGELDAAQLAVLDTKLKELNL